MEKVIKNHLIELAKAGKITTYSKLVEDLNLPIDLGLDSQKNELSKALDSINMTEVALGKRLMLSALVQNKEGDYGSGFYKCALELHGGTSVKLLRKEMFGHLEVVKIHKYWKGK